MCSSDLKIPISDTLLFQENASASSSLFGDAHKTGVKGTLFLFSSALIFKANSQKFPFKLFGYRNVDIVIQLKTVEAMAVNDSAVSFQLHTSFEPCESSNSTFWSCFIEFFSQKRQNILPGVVEVSFNLGDDETALYLLKILKERMDDINGTRKNSKSMQSFKPCFMMPSTKDNKTQSSMDPEEASALSKLFAQAQVMRFKPGDTILHIGAIERRLFCVWKGVVACKTSDGKVVPL